jgi:hypothetical protein
MKRRIDLYQRITGRKMEFDRKRPSFDETIAKFTKSSKTKFPLRFLGRGHKDLYMTEEEREVNMHIIGGSRQGKSKFIEHNIRKDIDMGFGLCLIDPSDFGATYKAVLDYCISINHPKVLLIDPNTLYDYGAVACLNPLDKRFPTKSAHAVKDSVNILLGSSEANTQRIQENLDALFRMLAEMDLTLYEASYFVDYEDPGWREILSRAKGRDAQIIAKKFDSYQYWKSEFTTTVTRLGVFRTEPVSLMIGAGGIDFQKMVDEGWVILCNLFPEPYLDPKTSRFLGILIISQIIRAVDFLNNRAEGFNKKFYLYIDEAGRFATPQIEDLLSYKSKSGLHLIFAHHHFGQFADKAILDAINHNTGIKVMFALRDYKDRLETMRQLGFPNPKEAADLYGNLPKQHAVIKKNKEHALEVVTPYISSVHVTQQQREEYIRERLKDPWYLAKYEIEDQINARINPAATSSPPPVERAVSDRQTTSHSKKTRPKSLLDLGDEAEQFIRNHSPSKPDGKKQAD